jgi:hypothetical protein
MAGPGVRKLALRRVPFIDRVAAESLFSKEKNLSLWEREVRRDLYHLPGAEFLDNTHQISL